MVRIRGTPRGGCLRTRAVPQRIATERQFATVPAAIDTVPDGLDMVESSEFPSDSAYFYIRLRS